MKEKGKPTDAGNPKEPATEPATEPASSPGGTGKGNKAPVTCAANEVIPNPMPEWLPAGPRCCTGFFDGGEKYAQCDTSSCPNNFGMKNLLCHNFGSPQFLDVTNDYKHAGSANCPYIEMDKAICDTSEYTKKNGLNCRNNPNSNGGKNHCLGKVKCLSAGVKSSTAKGEQNLASYGHDGELFDGTEDYYGRCNDAAEAAGLGAGTTCFYMGNSGNFKVCGEDGLSDEEEAAGPQPEPEPEPEPEPAPEPEPDNKSDPTFDTTCPVAMPEIGAKCGFDGTCEYGSETCCDGSTHAELVYECVDGYATAYHTDACFGITCKEPAEEPKTDKKVIICHGTSSDMNPYNALEVSENAVQTHMSAQHNKGKTYHDAMPGDEVTISGKKYVLGQKCELPDYEQPEDPEPEPEEKFVNPSPTPGPNKGSGSGDPHFKVRAGLALMLFFFIIFGSLNKPNTNIVLSCAMSDLDRRQI